MKMMYQEWNILFFMYQTIQQQPLLGGIQGINRKTGKKNGPIQSTICIFVTAIQGTIAYIEVNQNESPVSQTQGNWINSIYQTIEWTQVFDSQTVSMQQPVLYVSFQVQQYSQSYMETDAHKNRFYSYQSQFSFFMQIQQTGENQQIMFVGWEGVGLISYLQVNFWFTRQSANFGAQKAFQQNRVGDAGQALGLLLSIAQFGDQSFSNQFSMGSYINGDIQQIQIIQLVIGATAKSGQIGLSTWQTAAMEGPTPVSAQLHAATMVTAGVYQLMRSSPQLEYSSTGQMIITQLGGFSAQLGAAGGLQENDMKRIIAYSTTSQQGYMIIACGISQYNIALFHQTNHAYFKAQQFQAAGSVIHAIGDIQDIRKMGGQIMQQPRTYAVIQQGSQSQMAFPFQTGFYSKDFLLELAQIPRNQTNTIAYQQALIAAIQTSTYSSRQMIMTFLSKPNYPRILNSMIMEPSIFMTIPLILQAFGSVFIGYQTHDLYLGQGTTNYQQIQFTHPNHFALLDGSMSPKSGIFIEYLPLQTQQIQITIIPYKMSSTKKNRTRYNELYLFTNTQNSFNVFNYWIIISFYKLSIIIVRSIDRGLQELIGPLGQIRQFHYQSFRIECQATGYIPHYIIMIQITIISIIMQ